ncbi:MAG: PIN domain-containing protein [bacterium]|nr:PIN domain-containing protein [bacterium]
MALPTNKEILKSEKYPKVLPDTNMLIGYSIEDDKYNYEAEIAINALKKKSFYFIIPSLVVGEFISKYSEKKNISTKKAIEYFENNLLDKLGYSLRGGKSLNLDEILRRYIKISRKRTCRKLQFNDFMILSEVADIKKIKIITCDRTMFLGGRNLFQKDIYYLPNKYKKRIIKSDLSRLINDIRNIIPWDG